VRFIVSCRVQSSKIGCADDRRRIIRVNSNDALRTSAHPIGSASYRVRIYSSIQDSKDIPNAHFIERLKNEFIVGYETSKRDANKGKDFFSGKFICLIPQGGFVHNNVQRILLTCGSKNHLNSVPMAIFVE
jgi:hypothetical protein